MLVFSQRVSLKQFYLYIKLLQSSTSFKQQNNLEVSCDQKDCMKYSQKLSFKKYNCNSAHSYNRKTRVDIPFYELHRVFQKKPLHIKSILQAT